MEFEREAVANGQAANSTTIHSTMMVPAPTGQITVFVIKVHPSIAGGPRSDGDDA